MFIRIFLANKILYIVNIQGTFRRYFPFNCSRLSTSTPVLFRESQLPLRADNDTDNDRLAAHQPTQPWLLSKADYHPDVADLAQADFINSLVAYADETLGQLPIHHQYIA